MGRQQAEPPTPFSCGGSRIPQPIPQGPVTGNSLDRAAPDTQEMPTSATRLWACCVPRVGLRGEDGTLSFVLSMCFRFARGQRQMNISSVKSHSDHPGLCGGTWHCKEMGRRKEAQVAMPNANENKGQRNNTQSISCPSLLGPVLQHACLRGGKIAVISSPLLALSFQRNN